MVVLRGPEQPRHPLHRVGRRIRVAHVVEELEERLCGPLAGQAQQVEQIPHLDRVDLHRGRGEQHEPLRTVLERPHQAEQRIRASFLLSACTAASRVVRLVQHHEIPRLGFVEECARPVAPAHQVAGGDDHRLSVPFALSDLPLVLSSKRGRRISHELPPVVDRPVEVELLPKLDLPLTEHRLRRHDEDAFRSSGEPCLAQQHPGLDRLAEPDLVGDEQLRRPSSVELLEGPHLVRPRSDRRRRLTDERSAPREARRIGDEGPYEASPVDRRIFGRWLQHPVVGVRLPVHRFDRIQARSLQPLRHAVGRHEPQQIAAHCLGDVDHEHPARTVRPEAGEVSLFLVDAIPLRSPALEDVDRLPVSPPSGRGLVEASGPGDPIAASVFDDAGLLVEEGVVRDGVAMLVARHRHLHLEVSLRHHPRHQLQRFFRRRVGRDQRHVGEVFLHLLPDRFALLDRVDLGLVQRAADDEPHAAVVAHQSFDAACGEGERAGVEVAGQPVVALGVLKGRDVEPLDEIAVFGGVLQLPFAIAEHRRGRSALACAMSQTGDSFASGCRR